MVTQTYTRVIGTPASSVTERKYVVVATSTRFPATRRTGDAEGIATMHKNTAQAADWNAPNTGRNSPCRSVSGIASR